jgi:hypothetical protein
VSTYCHQNHANGGGTGMTGAGVRHRRASQGTVPRAQLAVLQPSEVGGADFTIEGWLAAHGG